MTIEEAMTARHAAHAVVFIVKVTGIVYLIHLFALAYYTYYKRILCFSPQARSDTINSRHNKTANGKVMARRTALTHAVSMGEGSSFGSKAV